MLFTFYTTNLCQQVNHDNSLNNFTGHNTSSVAVAAPGLGIWGGIWGATCILGGQDRISRNLPSPRCQNFWPLDFFPYIFSEIFSRTFLIFFQTFKNCSGLPKIFPRPTKNVIFLATFHKFLHFCLSNSDVSTAFGHFSQKSPLCRCGSYTHGSQRLMISTEIIKNWGGGKMGGQKIILGLPPGAATAQWWVWCYENEEYRQSGELFYELCKG